MPSSYRFVVRGRVQGVFFRQSTVAQARALGVTGWVRNREDGCVEGVASGTDDALARLHEWLRRGPPAAKVEGVEWSEADEVPGGEGFGVSR